jgi:hypothetical protein
MKSKRKKSILLANKVGIYQKERRNQTKEVPIIHESAPCITNKISSKKLWILRRKPVIEAAKSMLRINKSGN